MRDYILRVRSVHSQIVRVYTIGRTVESRPIWAVKISDRPAVDEGEPKVLFIGGHHASEWLSIEIPMHLIDFLVKNYSRDERVTRLVDGREIWVVPLLNVDGYVFDRKNRIAGKPITTRKNRNFRAGKALSEEEGMNGVDLNRNYSYRWETIGAHRSSDDPLSPYYRGEHPFSEPETRAIRNLAMRRNFSIVISFHSYGEYIFYPWSYTNEFPPDRERLAAFAERVSHLNGYFPMQSGMSYGSSGAEIDWFYGELGVPAFQIELGGFEVQYAPTPPVEEIQRTWNKNREALLYIMENPRLPEDEVE
ncbi:MAG: M14 family metallopeptidase [bacterium]